MAIILCCPEGRPPLPSGKRHPPGWMHGPVGSLLLGCRLAFFYFHGIHKSVWRQPYAFMYIERVTPIRLNLKALREEAGLSQEELAEIVGTRQATISRLERNLTQRVDLPLIDALCKALKCEPGDLLVRKRRT